MSEFKLKSWRYKNTFFLAISIVLLLIFADHAIIRGIVSGISGLGYVGLFLAGFFIVSTFTIVPATLLLAEMSKLYGFWEAVLFATIGAVIGDYLIFRLIKNTIIAEWEPIFKTIGKEKHLYKLFHSPLFGWLSPVVGAAIIASPLPDELGLSILGISKISTPRFIMLAIALDFIGTMLLVSILKSL